MKWSDKYLIGISIVDNQHKQLFNTYGDLCNALREGLRPKQVEEILTRLQYYVTRHFQMEEKYMQESNYPGIEEQQKAHKYFTQRFKELGGELKKTGITPDIIKTIKGELSDWLKEHVTGLDLEFGQYYQEQKKQS